MAALAQALGRDPGRLCASRRGADVARPRPARRRDGHEPADGARPEELPSAPRRDRREGWPRADPDRRIGRREIDARRHARRARLAADGGRIRLARPRRRPAAALPARGEPQERRDPGHAGRGRARPLRSAARRHAQGGDPTSPSEPPRARGDGRPGRARVDPVSTLRRGRRGPPGRPGRDLHAPHPVLDQLRVAGRRRLRGAESAGRQLPRGRARLSQTRRPRSSWSTLCGSKPHERRAPTSSPRCAIRTGSPIRTGTA